MKTPRPLLKTDTNGRAGEWFWLVFAIFSEHKRSRGGVGLWYNISMSKVKATIENLSENPNELWLIVSRELTPELHKKIKTELSGVDSRLEDSKENVAYALLANEVEAIRDACDEWLELNSDS